ncbi:stage II sporulation protein M [Blautia marasmi]|uniref:stage II sporulation protein M n=1 Tax=Blautia marasmi TaxID=1917868 RepID=UPI000CF25B48|nr:stage II sporulation protein M [Blautia marasmi]
MKKYLNVFFLLYLGGFVVGVLCSNFLRNYAGYQTSLLGVYMADRAAGSVSGSGIFLRLFERRGGWVLLYMISGVTPFGIPLVLGGLLWPGFLGGNLMTVFLMEYGIRGIGAALACFFPQGIFYVPSVLLFFFFIVQMSQKYWGKGIRVRADYRAYLFFMTGIGILFLLALFMESYVNQNVLSFVIERFL